MAIVRFSDAARSDISQILLHTQEQFGDDARRRYERLLVTAFRDLADDPIRSGSLSRPDIGPGVRSFHLRHSRERARLEGGVVYRPRQFILFQNFQPALIDIGRLLHDAMEIQRHIPAAYGDEDG